MGRGRAATECIVCTSGGPPINEVDSDAVWLAAVALTYPFRVEVGGFSPACVRAGAGALSGMLVLLRTHLVCPSLPHRYAIGHLRTGSSPPRGGRRPPPRLMPRCADACALVCIRVRDQRIPRKTFCIKYRSAKIDATLLIIICASDRDMVATECTACTLSDPPTDGVDDGSACLAAVALTHHLRVEASGFVPACARVNAGALIGLIVRLRARLVRSSLRRRFATCKSRTCSTPQLMSR